MATVQILDREAHVIRESYRSKTMSTLDYPRGQPDFKGSRQEKD
jgi:hypothetical protein